MPRREVPLAERPQHLRVFCEALRDVRRQSGLTLKQLSAVTHYAESTLSRVTNALDLPPWKQVETFLIGCGGGDLERWHQFWQATQMQHELFLSKGVNEPPAAKLQDAAAAQTTARQLVMDDDRPATLGAFLQRAETAQDLVRGIRMLGERTGTISLRQMEERCRATNVRLAKSTIRDWLAGERRPTKLDALVTALGATPAEQRHFAQCLERVWSQNPPVLQISSRPTYTDLGRRRGRHCVVFRVTVYDRALSGGMVWVGRDRHNGRMEMIDGIVGLSIGPTHSMAGAMALLPKVARRGEIELGIWVASPAEVSGLRLDLGLRLETPDRPWPMTLQIQLPTYRPVIPSETYGDVIGSPDGTSQLVETVKDAARYVELVRNPETADRAAALRRSKPSPAAAAAATVRMKPQPPGPADAGQGRPDSYRPKHRKKGPPRGLLQRLLGRSDGS
ncbi:helix-turn-helix domain-containing protein [Kribbella sp. NPDC049174]|uniref:helix-turn-helix domain-containing protein n=1 Tax=Kribbella sp. NPDC049174 TaxID=3364112 RepID=UPI00372355F3